MSIINYRVAVWDDEKQTAAENRKPSTRMYERHKDMVTDYEDFRSGKYV